MSKEDWLREYIRQADNRLAAAEETMEIQRRRYPKTLEGFCTLAADDVTDGAFSERRRRIEEEDE